MHIDISSWNSSLQAYGMNTCTNTHTDMQTQIHDQCQGTLTSQCMCSVQHARIEYTTACPCWVHYNDQNRQVTACAPAECDPSILMHLRTVMYH
jgi:hypothetical protein